MLSQEYQTLLNSLYEEIDRMKIDELRQFGEYAISKNISSAGTRLQPAADIMTKYGQKKIGATAELGVKDIGFKEEQRQFGITTEQRQQQINQQRREYEETKALNERALKAAEDERKRAARDWWRPFVSTAVGIGASLLFPPAAPALMAANVGSNIYKNIQPNIKPSPSFSGDPFYPKQYDPYANMPKRY